jgi:hypothetical protein
VNSKCLLGLLEKIVVQGLKQTSSLITIYKCDKIKTNRLILWAIQWTPMESRAQALKVCQVTFDLVPWKIETPPTQNVISLVPINFFVKSFCIRTWIRLSTHDLTTTHSRDKRIGIVNQFWTTSTWTNNQL